MSINIDDCFAFSPRMTDLDHTEISMSIPNGDFFSSLLKVATRLNIWS